MCHGDTEQYLYTKDLGEAHFQVWEKVVASYSGCCSVENCTRYISLSFSTRCTHEVSAIEL